MWMLFVVGLLVQIKATKMNELAWPLISEDHFRKFGSESQSDAKFFLSTALELSLAMSFKAASNLASVSTWKNWEAPLCRIMHNFQDSTAKHAKRLLTVIRCLFILFYKMCYFYHIFNH